MSLRAAVVGVGYLGNFHAQKYKSLTGVQLVGVCDTLLSQAVKVATDLGVRAFSKPQDLLGEVDLVTIASTTRTHFELAQFFLSHGVHVNVEKPMTVTVAEAEELVQLAAAKNLVLTVGHIERFNPAVVALKAQMQKPKIIELQRHAPFKARGADVSVVHDLMVHDIDLLLSMVPSPVVKVHARGSKVVTNSWDVASATFEFANGVLGFIHVSRIASAMTRSVKLVDQNFQIFANTQTGELEKISQGTSEQEPLKVEKWTVDKKDALLQETETFVKAVQKQGSLLVTGQDGLQAMKFVETVVGLIEKFS